MLVKTTVLRSSRPVQKFINKKEIALQVEREAVSYEEEV